MSIKMLPLPAEFLERVWIQRRDDQAQEVQPFVSTHGGEALRCCVRPALAGEHVALVSFSPFVRQNAFKEFGPIFMHTTPCEGPPRTPALPVDFDGSNFSFRAYSAEQVIIDATLAPGARARDAIAALLTRPEVAHVDARFAGYGCFLARFVRVPEGADGGAC
ncbi:DUF1203 domain-containing protein [Myxococcus sp. Y35]|uniref:DUF1203 domain-containing protein n=1 Tax=Pseudomyxococcus flavus TaxID=3115648 RepID=UPI003CE7E962